MLLPATVEECFRFAQEAFNLAEKFQTMVFCLSDLDLGMNNWMSDPFRYPDDIPIDRGKVLAAEELERLGKFSRYLDVDGDGIPYRTLPGTNHPAAAYFTRGSGHNEHAEYTERTDDYVKLDGPAGAQDRRRPRCRPPPRKSTSGTGSEIGIIAYGTTHHAIGECRDQLRAEQGIETDYLRIRALPLAPAVRDFLATHERIYVVEQNRDGQMASILTLDCPEQAP